MRQDAAREEIAELLFHERWEPRPVGMLDGGLEESIEMVCDYTVQDLALGIARPVLRGWERHAREVDGS